MNARSPLKVLMQSIKFCIGLLPQDTRKKLRTNLWLYNLYSKSLHHSGLFYGVPSAKKLNKLYQKVITRQDHEIQQCVKSMNGFAKAEALIVLCDDPQANCLTLQSLIDTECFSNAYLFGSKENVDISLGRFSSQTKMQLVRATDWQAQSQSNVMMLLRGGDTLHPHAVPVFFSYLIPGLESQVIYCDCDSLNDRQQRVNAEFYPDWNPDLQLSTGYVKTGVLLSGRALVHQLRKFCREQTADALIAQWMVELYLFNDHKNVTHIPLTLVHQTRSKIQPWSELVPRFQRVIDSNLAVSRGHNADVAKVAWQHSALPTVSLIIPTKNAKQLVKTCIESIQSKTHYPHYEILLIDNNSDDPEALAYFDSLAKNNSHVQVLTYPHPFNYSAINNFAVKQAKGEIIGLVNNDIEVISPNWLTDLVSHAQRADIGCVGAKLYYPDKRIQHAGVVMGYGGGAGHAHKYFPHYHPGYMNRLVATHNYSVVTAACLFVSKADYNAVGGLNETDLTVAFNDVDFCLKVLSLGRRNLYCAESELFHHESVSRGLDNTVEKRQRFEQELTYLQDTWSEYIKADPAYNPNLTLKRENFSIKE